MHQPPSNSSKYSVLCLSTISLIVLSTKTISLKLSHYLCCMRWAGLHFRFVFILAFPSIYILILHKDNTFFLPFLSILAMCSTLMVSLNLTKLFCSRKVSPKPCPQVVWSIGSSPKLEKKPNSGSWVKVYSNGDVFEGEFYKGKCSGSGVYYYYMSGRYEGEWVDGKYDGFGVETWAKGSRYRGQYKQGLRHGLGVYRFYTGDVYCGEWFNGQCFGCGVYTCEDGSLYVGEFKWGVKHGIGQYKFRNGDKYAGEYFSDKMHGFGTYHFANGHRYEGAWHEGRRQGLGMYTFRNGDNTQSGHWQNGVLNISATSDSSSSVSHSKVLHNVQEAQIAAEKAANMTKIEERVNKAVASANKAANAARVAAVKAVQNQMQHDNHNNLCDDASMQFM